MLVVDHPERTVCNDDAIGGSEALFYPAGEVNSLFDKDYRVAACFLGGLITKPQGKPTLVPENDKRPAMTTIIDDFKEDN